MPSTVNPQTSATSSGALISAETGGNSTGSPQTPTMQAGTDADDPQPGGAAPAAGATGGGAIEPQTPAPTMSANEIATQERQRIQTINMSARPLLESGAVSQDYVDQMINSGTSAEAASHQMLQHLSGTQQEISMVNPALSFRVGREDRETVAVGLEMALASRMSGYLQR